MAQPKAVSNKIGDVRDFLLVWFGQLTSLIGSGLSGFALGVFVFQQTGSATQFALIALFARIPSIILSPFTGTLADRWDRKKVMLFSNVGGGAAVLITMLLFQTNLLQIWHIYVVTAAISICSAFQDPAYYASVSQLVPKEQYGRASGMVQTAENAAQIAPPILAGVLILLFGLPLVLLIDFATYLVGIGSLLVVHFPPLDRSSESTVVKGSLWRETVEGWNHMMKHRGFLALFLFGAATSFSIGLIQIVLTPLVLSFGSAAVLGVVFSVGGMGMFAGGLAMSIWGGPKRRVYGVYGFGLIQVVSLFAASLRSDAILIAASVFVLLFSIQIVRGCTAAIIRTHIPQDMQGRIFGLNRLIAWSTLPFSYIVAGPLVDRVFEPLLAPSGLLAGSIGKLIGVGAGRGIGFLLLALGCGYLLVIVISYLNPFLRHIENEPQVSELPSA